MRDEMNKATLHLQNLLALMRFVLHKVVVEEKDASAQENNCRKAQSDTRACRS
jgi:hypothetical protein